MARVSSSAAAFQVFGWMMAMGVERILIAAGGLAGCAGVALAAAGAHKGGAFTQTISTMLLVHAPLFIAVGLSQYSQSNRMLRLAALVLLTGLILFALDLYVRDWGLARLFPFAAPIGGSAMLAGWLGIALSALAHRK